MELRKGIMTNRELAEWFGIKEKSFRNARPKKLEILKNYAEFEEMRGKVNIIKIISAEFRKGSENYKIIKEKTKEQWDNSGLDTCRLVANKIKELCIKELNVADSTLYIYTCQSKRDLWGKVNSRQEGELGFCEGEFCKIVAGKCVVLNEEEKKIKDLLLKKHFGKAEEKIAITQGLIATGEISKEEGAEMMVEMLKTTHSSYYEFMTELRTLTNSEIVIGTRITNNALKQQLAPPREEEKGEIKK